MSKKILIVDDSMSIRQMVEVTLRGAGYNVDSAEDGQAARQRREGMVDGGLLHQCS